MYEAWREFAKQNGWTFHLGPMGYPYISGEYRKHQFNFDFGSYHFRFLRMPRFRMLLTFSVRNSTGVDFRLRGGFLVSFENLIRLWGLQTGEKSFDQQFILTGRPESLVLKLFANSKIRRGLQDARIRIGGISIKLRGQVLMCEPQFFSFNFSRVMNVLDIACDLTDAVNGLKELNNGD
jgi:hypothetical protein